MNSKVVRSEGLGLKSECKMCAKIYYSLHTWADHLIPGLIFCECMSRLTG